MINLKNKVAFITRSSRGVGQQITICPALVEENGPNGQFFSAIDFDLDPAAFHHLNS